MALLDFKCKNCGENFYEIVNSSKKNEIKCPKCGSKDVNQVFQGSSSFGTNTAKNTYTPKGGG